MKKYTIVYYLPNQSQLMSEPYCYSTDDLQAFLTACSTAKEKQYTVVEIITK